MTPPQGRIAALRATVAELARGWLMHARASKNYSRAKRVAREVVVAVATAIVTASLTGLLHGR